VALVAAVALVAGLAPATQAAATARITGQLSVPAGHDVTKIDVIAHAGSTGRQVAYTRADAAGNYALRVPAGSYRIAVRPAHPELRGVWYDGATSRAAARPVTVKAGRTTGSVNVSVPTADNVPYVEGRLVWSDGSAAAGVTIVTHIKEAEGAHEGWSYTSDASGRFRFPIYAGSSRQYAMMFLGARGGTNFTEYYEKATSLSSAKRFTLAAGQTLRLGEIPVGCGTTCPAASTPVTIDPAPAGAAPRTGSTTRVGQLQSVSTSAPAGTSVAVQWYRNGRTIAGAARPSYRLRPADVGREVTVRVSYARSGYNTYRVLTSAVTKTRTARPTLAVKARGAKKTAVFTVRVRATGATPTGKVTVRTGGKPRTVKLRNGRAVVRVGKLKPGKRTFRIVYSGGNGVAGTSVARKVRIG